MKHRIGKKYSKSMGKVAAWLTVFGLIAGMGGLFGCGGTGNTGEEKDSVKSSLEGEGVKPENGLDDGKVMGRYLEATDDSLKDELGVESKAARMEDGSLVIFSRNAGKYVSRDNGMTWEREQMAWYEEWRAEGTWVHDMAMAKDGYMAVIYVTDSKDEENTGIEENGERREAGTDAGEEGENGGSTDSEAGADAETVEDKGREADAETVEDRGRGADAGTVGDRGTGADAGIEGNSEAGADEGSMEGDGKEAGEETEGMELHTEDFSFQPKYGLIAPDGTFTELAVSYKDGDYINRLVFSEDGRLFGSSIDGRVYEIDRETGEKKEVAELSHWTTYMTEKDGKLMLVNSDGVTIVDTASGMIVEDKVLDDFLKAQFGSNIDSQVAGVKPLLLMPGEDGILYLALGKGIYRHVIGGNVMEQVVDGTLNSLSDPSCGLADGLLLEDNVFLLVRSSGEVMRYVYDPDTPAIPEIRLKAYSLRENGQLKTVISSYQAEHPEVYIQYETGMDENLAVTREDALKKLNTEIAAGKGPDILILDDMPIDSYVEKGVLMDLSPYVKDKTEDKYFTNILRSFETPEGIYALPGQFRMFLMVGRQEDIEKMAGLEAIAGVMESYREKDGESLLLGARSEEEMLSLLLPVCAPSWKDGNGKINKEALEEFYTVAKKIWDMEKGGIGPEQKESYERWIEEMREMGIPEGELRTYQCSASEKMLDYLSGRQKFVAGFVEDSFGFDVMVSCFKIKGKTDSGFTSCSGQAKNVYLPDGIMGISTSCGYPEIAAEILDYVLNGDGWDGIPVNKEKCMEKFLINAQEDGSSYGTMGIESEDGKSYLALDIYSASEEEITRLMDLASKAETPYVREPVLEDAVCLAGVKVLCGELDASAAAEEVIRKTAIYMTE